MALDFKSNWDFQEKYYPQVQAILEQNAMHFIKIVVADEVTDMRKATDFVATVDDGDVAVRIRRADLKPKHRGQLTIRCYKEGHRTEIHKIREGFGKYYLYCWEDGEGQLSRWMLLDIDKLRSSGLVYDTKRYQIPNTDGKTKLVAYTWKELVKNDCVIAHDMKGWKHEQLDLFSPLP